MIELQPTPHQQARAFARYGFVPEPNWRALEVFADAEFAALKAHLAKLSRRAQLDHVGDAADAAFRATFDGLGGDIVVPLSGGRDSRLILCMAIEHGLRDRVTTVTWGIPGGLDWEISAKVAAHFSVRHERIDTTAQPITFDDLRHAFDQHGHWSDLVSAHFNRRWKHVAAPGAVALIGYLCGSTIGCHYQPGHETLGVEASIAAFEAMNQRTRRGTSVIDSVGDLLLSRELVSAPEQLDIVFRQEGYLKRVVAPAALNTRAPFATPEWMRTFFALPPSCRVNGNLFSSFLIERFPKAFAIGTSGAHGLQLSTPHWRQRGERQLLRLRYAIANALRERHFLTLDKYGDERDLLSVLQTNDQRAPRQIRRLLQRQCASRDEAIRTRLHIMLLCNVLFQLERTAQSQCMNAA